MDDDALDALSPLLNEGDEWGTLASAYNIDRIGTRDTYVVWIGCYGSKPEITRKDMKAFAHV